MTDGIVSLLFTDLANSTELFAALGDEGMEDLRRTHFRLLREAVIAQGGTEVKNLGDGLMVAFPSAIDAVVCAVAMQRNVARHNRRVATDRMPSRAARTSLRSAIALSIRPVRAAIQRTFDTSASQSAGAARSSGRCQNARTSSTKGSVASK